MDEKQKVIDEARRYLTDRSSPEDTYIRAAAYFVGKQHVQKLLDIIEVQAAEIEQLKAAVGKGGTIISRK